MPQPPPPRIHSLSLHDPLPISDRARSGRHDSSAPPLLRTIGAECVDDTETMKSSGGGVGSTPALAHGRRLHGFRDRKSTRLNSSHQIISYAVFCLKKKNKQQQA